MGVARNAFHIEMQRMANVVLIVPVWDRSLTHSLVCSLLRKKKKEDSAHRYQSWQHKAVSACRGLHMGASAWVDWLVLAALFPTLGLGGEASLL